MDINTVSIIIEKMQQNLRYSNLIFFCLNSITHCDITEYCIPGLKTIYSNTKFFIFQLICILAKMVITFEPVGFFFHAVFDAVLQKICHLNHVFYSTLGTF